MDFSILVVVYDKGTPYLFITSMELQSIMFIRAEKEGSIKGIKITRDSLTLTHLLFADDLVLFLQAT